MEAVERGIGGTDFVGIHQRLGVICSSLQKSSQYHEQVMASLNDLSRGNFSVPLPVNHTDQLRDIRKKVSEINLSDLTLRVSDLSSQVQKIPTQIMDIVNPKLGEVSSSIQELAKGPTGDYIRGRGRGGHRGGGRDTGHRGETQGTGVRHRAQG